MSQNVYFSIIIPTYNRQDLIIKCIKNIKNQSFTNWECIIVNDGSTDSTKEHVTFEIKNDSRFKLINQKNSERAIARNNGAKHAVGKYFIFLDSDDYFGSNHLEDLHERIIKNGEFEGMYFCNGYTVKNNTKEIIHKQHINNKEINSTFFLKNAIVPARVCIHNTIFNYLQFDTRAIIVEDTILWIEILDKFPVKFLPIDSVYYLVHETNSVNINFNNAYLQRLNGLKILFEEKEIGKKIPRRLKKNLLNRCFLGIYDYYLLKSNHLLAFSWLLKSLLYYPNIEFKYKIKRLFAFKF